ncbi:hypothetical protein [Bacillus sp. 196mf]|uniref:hypothetical protein n=1 Tax=Bacillus sp. 196mf TaxID=1761754 RepID=UPI000D7C84E1|nr:hypothetical protein [Bacillus sp. 196mf]PYE88565.1 hypothetical protein ATL10_104412 [Bacillus sp. 196mf]
MKKFIPKVLTTAALIGLIGAPIVGSPLTAHAAGEQHEKPNEKPNEEKEGKKESKTEIEKEIKDLGEFETLNAKYYSEKILPDLWKIEEFLKKDKIEDARTMLKKVQLTVTLKNKGELSDSQIDIVMSLKGSIKPGDYERSQAKLADKNISPKEREDIEGEMDKMAIYQALFNKGKIPNGIDLKIDAQKLQKEVAELKNIPDSFKERNIKIQEFKTQTPMDLNLTAEEKNKFEKKATKLASQYMEYMKLIPDQSELGSLIGKIGFKRWMKNSERLKKDFTPKSEKELLEQKIGGLKADINTAKENPDLQDKVKEWEQELNELIKRRGEG